MAVASLMNCSPTQMASLTLPICHHCVSGSRFLSCCRHNLRNSCCCSCRCVLITRLQVILLLLPSRLLLLLWHRWFWCCCHNRRTAAAVLQRGKLHLPQLLQQELGRAAFAAGKNTRSHAIRNNTTNQTLSATKLHHPKPQTKA